MKILLVNTQAMLGDRLMFTPVVRDLKNQHPDWQIGVESFGPEIWENNPHIEQNLRELDAVYQIGPAKVTKGSKTNGLHITAAFRSSLEEQLNETIKQGPFRPEIFLSEAEKSLKIIDGRYWVINIDCGPFSAKRWYHERWQQVVEALSEITFVQVGLKKDNQYRLRGANVIDLIDKTKIRELFSLVYNAEGCISLISSLMHVAAAFEKPCVVLAGAREPLTFEKYPNHRYIDKVGCLPCCEKQACWKNSIGACKNRVGDIARCMDMITTGEIIDAVKTYYEGGILNKVNRLAVRRKIIRIVTNAKCLGGAERSVLQIAKMFGQNNWRVEISAAGTVCEDFRKALPERITLTNHISRPCDVILLYASDMVFNFDKPQFEMFNRLEAQRKVMALTYKLGKAGQVRWTKDWNKYLFLSSDLCEGFKQRYPPARTAVLAPAVDLEPFLKDQPDYSGPLRLVRHSSQGDNKYPRDLAEICKQSPAQFYFMPGPSWLRTERNISLFSYEPQPDKVAEFLAKGNCFWYLLPQGYTDQGPRVIVEAMAAGLAVIAERRDGGKDRVTTQTGWLIDKHEEVIDLLHSLSSEQLRVKGQTARERAIEKFRAELWYENIIGD